MCHDPYHNLHPVLRRLPLSFVLFCQAVLNWKMATGSWASGWDDEQSKAEGFTPWKWGCHQLKIYDHQPTYWQALPPAPAV